MTPAERTAFWRRLPIDTLRGFRQINPLHISAGERKAADGLPAEARAAVARLLSDRLEDVLAARRRLVAYGPTCRSLVVDQLCKLPDDSPRRLLHEGLLRTLEFEEAHERCIRVTEAALQKTAQLSKTRGKSATTIGVLVSRRICDGRSNDPYGSMRYYNFLHKNHDYKAGVALEFGNGDGNCLDINFYGGQDNRIEALGATDYARVKTAPNGAVTAGWWKNGQPLVTAAVGHVYRLHVVDPRDQVDFAVKFRVLDMSPEEWIVIEWEYLPQER
jgi:hypothetical protein